MEKFDVAIIGGGPGGYVCAIRCAQLGLRTVCIDNWVDAKGKPSLGGTCLNVGCIPSKAMLDSSHHFHAAQHDLVAHGIHVSGVELDLDVMQQRRVEIVKALTGGVEMLFAKHKVQWIKGLGRLSNGKQIEVVKHDQSIELVGAEHIVIATGSTPHAGEGIVVDHEKIIDSTDALELKDVPPRLAVLGAGAVGLELGSVWSRLGSKVTVLHRRDKFLPNVDRHIAEEAYLMYQLQGLDIRLSAQVASVKATPKQVTVTFTDTQGETKLHVDRVLVATGRKPNTTGLNAEAAGLKMDDRGRIEVDAHCRTNLPNVWAIGDVVRGPMLAHKASEEGVMVAERIAGQKSEVNYDVIPFVIYTWPEIAWVGKTPQDLLAAGIPFRAGIFPFKANGRARAMGATGGSVKIVAEETSDRVLGVHILGPNASEMIAQAVTAMEFGASAEDLARTVHAHPTLSEAFHEAALAVDKRTLHI